MSFEGFGDKAKSLGKNPIGIVALFLVLIYGFAALLLSLSSSTLTEAQRWPFVWFLVLFPLILLATFTYLVVMHHEKLYAPSEYRDERHFFKKLGPEAQKERLEKTVDELVAPEGEDIVEKAETDNYRPLDREEVRLRVSVAEDLALRAMEQKLATTISREVAVRSGNGWINLDGAVVQGDELLAIEVKHIRGGRIGTVLLVEHLLELLEARPLNDFRSVRLALIVVSEDLQKQMEELRSRLDEVIKAHSVPVDIYFLDLDELKAQFGLDT